MNLCFASHLTCPDHIAPHHWDEWVVGSAVDPGLVALNLRSLNDLEVDPLTHEIATPIVDLLNWKYVRFGRQVKQSIRGWWVSGIDPLNGKAMDWGRFKPDSDTPVLDRQKGESAKYLSPKGVPSRATFLRVTWAIGLRIAQTNGKEQSYRDRQSGQSLTSEDLEFWQWVRDSGISIGLAEGEKKAGALLTQGIVAIALPGIFSGYRKETGALIPDLQVFATKGRAITFCFDHETKAKTVEAVRISTYRTASLFSFQGCVAKVATLPGPEKGVDDFLVAQGGEALQQVFAQAKPFLQWAIAKYTQLDYQPSLELNQRYLGSLPIPEDAKLVAIRSPKGTGKTESLVEIVARASELGQRVLLLSHRVQLAQAICDRLGLPYVTELRTAEAGSLLGYGLCVDSLHPESQARFDAEYWKNSIVIVDECEQVLWHKLSATTEVQSHRMEILRQFQQLVEQTINSENGKIILCDADLSNLSIQYIQGIVPVKPWIVVNRYQPQQPTTIHHYNQQKPHEWFQGLVAAIEAGERTLILLDSQKAKSRYSTTTLEAHLSERFPGKKILRIDSRTIADPTHAAYGCVNHLNTLLLNYDIVIVSPSIETGVSIDIKGHFASVWGCFQGAIAADSVRQFLARLREPVDRHLWVAKRGLQKVGNGATSTRSLLKSQQQMAQANIRFAEFHFEGDEITSNLNALNTWAKMAVRINTGAIAYRQFVLDGLAEEGHIIVEAACPLSPTLLEDLTTTRDEQYLMERCSIADQEEITDKQYEELKAKKTKTLSECHQERKHKLQQRYLVAITPELIEKDDAGWHPQIRLHYYLVFGKQFLKDRDKQTLEALAKKREMWLPTINRSQLGIQISILEHLGIKELLKDPEREFRGKDSDLERIAALAKAHSWEIKAALGVTLVSSDSTIKVIQKLLDKVGQRLTYDRREGPRGDRQRVYRYIPAKDGRIEIFTAWLERDSLANPSVSTIALKDLAA